MKNAAKVIDIQSGNLPAVIDLEVTNKMLSELGEKYATLPEDLSQKDNYDFIQKGINELRSYRPKVKAKGKELKDNANEWIRKVTAEEKRIDAAICKILDPMAEHKKVYDDKVAAEKEAKRKAEQARKDAHLAGINGIRLFLSQAQFMKSDDIENLIEKMESVKPEPEYEEFQKEAEGVYDDTLFGLQELLIKVQNQEESDRKRAAEDTRLKAEKEKLAREKAEFEAMQLKAAKVAEQDAVPVHQQPSSSAVSPQVQKEVKEDGSVIDKMRNDTKKAILLIISDFDDSDAYNGERIADGIMNAIYQGRIPNVRFEM